MRNIRMQTSYQPPGYAMDTNVSATSTSLNNPAGLNNATDQHGPGSGA